jgi:ELWxxDGT repeat protein
VRVRDINPGSGSSDPSNLTVVGSTLFFWADDGSSGAELWKSDGSSAGTVRVQDINPGSGSSNPSNLTAVGSCLFFTASDGSSGYELWKSDGTSAGTVRVQDINPGSGSSNPSNLTALGSTLFFNAYDASGGSELWALDVSDQLPAISVSVIPASVSEDGAANLNFLFTRNDPAGQLLNLLPELSIRYSISGSASASAADYSGAAPGRGQTITFAAGSSLAILSIDPNADSSFEPDETVIVTLENSTDYVLSAQSSAAAVILNDDPDYSFGPITINGVNLGSTSLGYALRNSGGAPIQVTYPSGNASASNPGNGWNAVAAAPSGSGYSFYWRNSTSAQLAFWSLDSTGAYTSGYLLTESQVFAEEAKLNLDLNGDGYSSGPTTINGLNLGTTSLGYALRSAGAAPIQITYPGGNASASNPGSGWSAVAAAAFGSGYALYWRHSGSGQTARWDLNSSGAYSSGYLLSASQLISEEASLNLDVNGDGYTSGPTTLGGVNLGSTSLGYALRNPSGAPIQVTYPGGSASTSNPGGGWAAVAAAGTSGGYSIYWRNSGSGQVARWDLNGSGAYQTGALLSDSQVVASETSLSTDLNADAIIGPPFTSLESQGNATLLRRNSDGMAVVQVGSTHYAVSSPFGLGTGDSTTTWQMLAAETVAGKNQIAWRNNSGNFLHVWSLDAGWNWQSSAGNINPFSPEALALETSFQNDFNGNGVIG